MQGKWTVLHRAPSRWSLMDLRHKAGLGEAHGGGMEAVVLLVACDGDEASTSMLNAVLARGVFEQRERVEEAPTYTKGRVRLWCRSGFHLDQDHLDQRWTDATGEPVEDVLFLSARGRKRPSLPDGSPDWRSTFGTERKAALWRKVGDAPPPSPRLAAFWRALRRHGGDARIPEFEISLEVTHHGPWQRAPAAFLEVGSTEATWSHKGAAEVWADVILNVLHDELAGASSPHEPMHVPVLVTFGGGHYAPRANAMAAEKGALLGHMLANHSMPFIKHEDGRVEGRWTQAVDAATAATRAAHPGRNVVVSLDRKSFRGWERRALFDHLEAVGIEVVDSATHLSMLQGP